MPAWRIFGCIEELRSSEMQRMKVEVYTSNSGKQDTNCNISNKRSEKKTKERRKTHEIFEVTNNSKKQCEFALNYSKIQRNKIASTVPKWPKDIYGHGCSKAQQFEPTSKRKVAWLKESSTQCNDHNRPALLCKKEKDPSDVMDSDVDEKKTSHMGIYSYVVQGQ
ncbi:uncharacterized protein LOC114521614 isoform X4 [Dendronephthya gigantea]|uniref:uncharacterized protein LOC114521614 isoform X4 n=1 Tax=Dendronephthya gigantea TaxID=151771 RepID=UPI0010696ACB|nr:uncharacterized protein LOC114521614 isoform X4 [Dendronephthya gigantea]